MLYILQEDQFFLRCASGAIISPGNGQKMLHIHGEQLEISTIAGIVKKIMEDHGGQLVLSNGEGSDELPGAKAMMIFPPASISAVPPGDAPV